MWDVIVCIRDDHDLRLVAAAALICITASLTALRFHRRASDATGARFAVWAVLTGVVAGCGVWATHFIAMLAYGHGLPIRYDLGLTVLSLALAMGGLGAGLALAAWRRTAALVVAGGALTGLGIAAMHFVGVSAIRSNFAIEWNMPFVAASILVAVAGGAGAALANRRLRGIAGWIVPPLLLVAGICGLHFTAMTAITLVPDLTLAAVPELISRTSLAALVGGPVLVILVAAAALAVLETLTRAAGLASIQAVFSNVPSGLALFDADGRLLVWNSAYATMMEPLSGPLEPGMSRLALLTNLIERGESGLTEASRMDWMGGHHKREPRLFPEWELPDGTWRRAELHPMADGTSLTILSDITDIKAAAVEMAAAVDRAEAASRAKSDFLANMSHEIRTPLNGVLGMVQVMASDELAPPQRERLKVIRESGNALLGILNDILDLSKVQAGKFELEDEPFDIRALADATVAAFQGAASAKSVGLVIDIEPETPRGWRGDSLRLRQVISNLIGNAIKFTTEGTVRLEVAGTEGELILRVRDTGIGMDQDQIPRLFEKFSQADSTTTRRYGGTGLGLSICQEMVRLMGGDITAQSERGRGSCFTVTLPLPTAQIEIEPEAEPVMTLADDGDVLKILAAEDNRTNQIVLRSLLQPLGAELTLVENGREAVDAFAAGRFDIILMDAQMPEMNGVEATLAIREMEAKKDLPRTPILALSANVMTHQIEEYMAAGMDGWVGKPIELAALYAGIEKALGETEPGESQPEEVLA